MPYINDEKIAEIKNSLATILRVSLDTKQDNRLEDIIRQVGKIGGLLPQTCTYGKAQRERRLVFLRGYRKGQRESGIKKKLLKWINNQICEYNTSDCRWRRRRGVWWDGNYTGVLNILKEIKKTFCSGEKKQIQRS